MTAGIFDKVVNQRKIKFAFLRLNQIPVNGHKHGIKIAFGKAGPYGLHIIDARRSRITQFAREHQKGLTIHNQLRRVTLLLKMRHEVLLPCCDSAENKNQYETGHYDIRF